MTPARMLITYPDGQRQTFALGSSAISVGSAPGNDLVLPGEDIAPRHAAIRMAENGDLLIQFVCGAVGQSATVAEIELPRAFAPAMLLRIGAYVLSYKPASRLATRPLEVPDEQIHERAVGGDQALLQDLLHQDQAGSSDDPHDAVTMELPVLRQAFRAE
jgi:hypothetical protein